MLTSNHLAQLKLETFFSFPISSSSLSFHLEASGAAGEEMLRNLQELVLKWEWVETASKPFEAPFPVVYCNWFY